jgi:uncharacterized membrane protein YhiD involved in acid resistance
VNHSIQSEESDPGTKQEPSSNSYQRIGGERRLAVRVKTGILFSALLTVSAFLVQTWFSDVNRRLLAAESDHTELQILSVQVRNLAESQIKILEKLDTIETKVDVRNRK